MSLNDVAVRNAKPQPKPYKLTDERGLYLLVTVSGGRLWRYDYRYGGKRRTLALGGYPDVGLKDARDKRDEARKLLAAGGDPAGVRRAQKLSRVEAGANSFEVVAREWYAKHMANKARTHAEKVLARLEKDLFPWLGHRPMVDITAPELLACLRRVESRGALDTAHRALQNFGQVARYAIATGRAERDVAADLRGALPPAKSGQFAAITDPAQVGKLLRDMEEVTGGLVVKSALRLAPLLFVRPGELRTMKWSDIDLEQAEWRYTVSKTKTDHLVPLAAQAVAILRELQPLTGHLHWVFPGARSNGQPMSGMALNMALRRAGYDTREEQTTHGFRAVARTLLHEHLNFAPEIIEHQLAHSVPDALGTSYNRTKFLAQRKEMMQKWADYLDGLKATDGATVVPFRRQA
jgi:integrase